MDPVEFNLPMSPQGAKKPWLPPIIEVPANSGVGITPLPRGNTVPLPPIVAIPAIPDLTPQAPKPLPGPIETTKWEMPARPAPVKPIERPATLPKMETVEQRPVAPMTIVETQPTFPPVSFQNQPAPQPNVEFN
jgi:hypothetical protein